MKILKSLALLSALLVIAGCHSESNSGGSNDSTYSGQSGAMSGESGNPQTPTPSNNQSNGPAQQQP